MEFESKRPDEVVVVTGGAGFLGQHIVKQLIEQTEFPIREIRIFNRFHPLKWFPSLGVKEDTNVTVKQHMGDLCKLEDVQSAFKGASVVIHNAANIDVTSLPDAENIHEINVIGTKNVIQACVDNDIKIIVYTSSATVVDKIGDYGRSKAQAEDLVLQANEQRLNNGDDRMLTCALRCPGMYGEGNKDFVDVLNKGTVIQVRGVNTKCPFAYAGNIGWAHVCAVRQLRAASSDLLVPNPAGRAFGVADDTPVTSVTKMIETFAKCCGRKLSRFVIPLWLLYIIASICEWISFLLQPFYTLRFPISKALVDSLHRLPIFNNDEAKRHLDYKPIYNYEEGLKRTIRYFEHFVKLKSPK